MTVSNAISFVHEAVQTPEIWTQLEKAKTPEEVKSLASKKGYSLNSANLKTAIEYINSQCSKVSSINGTSPTISTTAIGKGTGVSLGTANLDISTPDASTISMAQPVAQGIGAATDATSSNELTKGEEREEKAAVVTATFSGYSLSDAKKQVTDTIDKCMKDGMSQSQAITFAKAKEDAVYSVVRRWADNGVTEKIYKTGQVDVPEPGDGMEAGSATIDTMSGADKKKLMLAFANQEVTKEYAESSPAGYTDGIKKFEKDVKNKNYKDLIKDIAIGDQAATHTPADYASSFKSSDKALEAMQKLADTQSVKTVGWTNVQSALTASGVSTSHARTDVSTMVSALEKGGFSEDNSYTILQALGDMAKSKGLSEKDIVYLCDKVANHQLGKFYQSAGGAAPTNTDKEEVAKSIGDYLLTLGQKITKGNSPSTSQLDTMITSLDTEVKQAMGDKADSLSDYLKAVNLVADKYELIGPDGELPSAITSYLESEGESETSAQETLKGMNTTLKDIPQPGREELLMSITSLAKQKELPLSSLRAMVDNTPRFVSLLVNNLGHTPTTDDYKAIAGELSNFYDVAGKFITKGKKVDIDGMEEMLNTMSTMTSSIKKELNVSYSQAFNIACSKVGMEQAFNLSGASSTEADKAFTQEYQALVKSGLTAQQASDVLYSSSQFVEAKQKQGVDPQSAMLDFFKQVKSLSKSDTSLSTKEAADIIAMKGQFENAQQYSPPPEATVSDIMIESGLSIGLSSSKAGEEFDSLVQKAIQNGDDPVLAVSQDLSTVKTTMSSLKSAMQEVQKSVHPYKRDDNRSDSQNEAVEKSYNNTVKQVPQTLVNLFKRNLNAGLSQYQSLNEACVEITVQNKWDKILGGYGSTTLSSDVSKKVANGATPYMALVSSAKPWVKSMVKSSEMASAFNDALKTDYFKTSSSTDISNYFTWKKLFDKIGGKIVGKSINKAFTSRERITNSDLQKYLFDSSDNDVMDAFTLDDVSLDTGEDVAALAPSIPESLGEASALELSGDVILTEVISTVGTEVLGNMLGDCLLALFGLA
ncbi:Nif11 family protein [Desulfovibrio inopinatus]|uniref:Nif11 family protein n=1 Tax=Desulfovibrio inopinatus TaxID=102109 RepID=UPI000428F6A0|nr:Nif11 family protein [Desulfovibrio inopinatus]